MSDINWQEAKRAEVLSCPVCSSPIFTRANGSIVPHWTGGEDAVKCAANDRPFSAYIVSSKPPADATQEPLAELPPLEVTKEEETYALRHYGHDGAGNHVLASRLGERLLCRERQLLAALTAKQMFESTVASQAAEMAALRTERDDALESVDLCRQLEGATLPCGHNSRYGFTDNGGKTGYCVMCDNTRMRDALDGVMEFYPTAPDEDSVTHFERIAETFRRETGYLRPGKDCRLHSYEKRCKIWDAWYEARVTKARAALNPIGTGKEGQ